MIGYFDASALVKRYVEESGSDVVRALLGESLTCTSRLSEVEIVSALVRRAREGSISEFDRDRALSTLAEDMTVLYVVELSGEITMIARGVLLKHRLRASDAIQIASCVHLQESTGRSVLFAAFDDRLNEAAIGSGLRLAPTS